MNDNKQPNKSLEDLLKTKKTKQAEKTSDDSNDLRKKMNRLVDANKVFDDGNDFESQSKQLDLLESEKKELQKELKELNKKLKNLYNLKYDDLKIIDKKNDILSDEFKSALDNAKALNEEEKSRFENMNLELESLQTQIKALKANNIASRKASEEAIAAANLAQEAADKARSAFEEKERNSNKNYKEEIEKLNNQLIDITGKLNKSNVEKTKLNNTINSLKKANKEHLENLEKVEKDLEEANILKEQISSKLVEAEAMAAENDLKLAKLNEAKLNLKDNMQISQKEFAKQEAKFNKLLEEKNDLKSRFNALQKDFSKSEQRIEKLNEEKNALNDSLNNLKQDLNNANSSVKKLENNVAKLEALKQEKVNEISQVKKENSSLLKKIEKLQNELESKLSDTTDLDLKKQLEEKQKELDKIQNNYNKSLENINNLRETQKIKIQEVKKEVNDKAKEEKKIIRQDYNQQIKDLNKEINKLNRKINDKDNKIKELKGLLNANNQSEEKDKIIDDLSLKLVDHEEQISVLEEKNKDLEEQIAVIPTLNESIEKLNNNIKDKEEQIVLLQEQIKEPKIDESIIKEMEDMQNELNKTMTNLEEMRVQKLNLEIEVQKAYNALKEQEELLALQENLITKQQTIVNMKDKDYQESLIKYENLEREYVLAKENYDNEIRLLNQDNNNAQDKLNELFELQKKLDDANLEIQKKTIQLEDSLREIENLKNIKEKNEEIIKQYLNDIEINEKKVSEYLVSVSQNEVYVEELRNRLIAVNEEYSEYKLQKENELNTLNEELNSFKEKLNSVEDCTKKLELSKFNEERLQSRIYDLENSIKVLSIKENSKSDSTIISSLEQYRTLLANERKEHLEAETILSNKVKDLNKELDDLNKRFVNYSSSYVMSKLNKQINSINDIISSMKTGKALFNRDIYNEYYEESLKMYYEQRKIYSSEIEKRNELLQIIKTEKEQEIKDLSYEVQISGVNTVSSGKLKVLYQQVKDIDLIINSSIRSYAPMSSEAVEEEILKYFKKELFAYHKQMEENITLIEKHISEKYNEAESFERLLEMYSNDCLEMANKYSDEISRLYEENIFDANEFSRLIREEKILMLVNEFQSLVRIRDEKYTELHNKLVNLDNDISYDQYNDSLNNVEELKLTLLKKLDAIKIEEQKVKDVLYSEKKRIFEDIESLNDQLVQLEHFSNDELIEEDKRKINILLAAKRERISLLDETKIPEMDEKYANLKEEIKISYDEAVSEENAIKEAFTKRKEAIHASKHINNNVAQQIKVFNAYENINSYLVDLNNIDSIFSQIKSNRKNYRPIVRENQNNRLNAILEKYKNLWALYDKYELAKTTMEEDFEEIRAYNNFKLEASSSYRKYCEYLEEIDLSEERFRTGFDLDQNIVKSLHAKANTAKSRVDYLNRQASELLHNSSVNDYVELVNKIEQIRNLIKRMDSELVGII